jgi:hypothetical protein
MKVIPQTCHSHYIRYLRFYFYFTMSVPDEGYSTNTSFAHYISYLRSYFYFTMSAPYESYSTNTSFALHYISSFLFLFYYEPTWWRLFHKHVIRTILYILLSIFILLWAYLMKVIPQTHHSHHISYLRFYFYFTMSVPDESYSINTSFELHYISWFLFLFYYERTWWRLLNKHVIRTTLYIFVSIFIYYERTWWMVIPQTRHSHYICYLHFYFYFTMSVPDEGYSTTRYSHYIIYLRFYLYFNMSVPDEGYSKNMSFTLH